MKKIFLFTLFLFFYKNLYCQISNYSEFYSKDGKLLIDTSIKIDDVVNTPYLANYNRELIFDILQNLKYPNTEFDNGESSTIVLEIDILPYEWNIEKDTYLGKVENIRILKTTDAKLNSTQILSNLNELKKLVFIFPKEYKSDKIFKIYIPIRFLYTQGKQFKIEKYCEDGAITIKTTDVPLVVH